MQHINLYLDEFKPKKELLSFGNALIALGVFMFLMVALQVFSTSGKEQLQQDLATAESRKSVLDEQLKKLKIKPDPGKLLETQKQAELLRLQIKNRKTIAAIINGEKLGNRSGFSNHLQTMGAQLVKGVSLSGFDFKQGGKQVSLSGQTNVPNAVPLYISKLQTTDVFANSLFGTLSMKEVDGRLIFSTGSADKVALAHVDKTAKRKGVKK